jgi:hypothetical protein
VDSMMWVISGVECSVCVGICSGVLYFVGVDLGSLASLGSVGDVSFLWGCCVDLCWSLW